MIWQKHGKIFQRTSEFSWNKSHAQTPVVDILTDRLRIYYSTRNEQGQSNISYIEVDKDNPLKVLYEHNKTILEFGKAGTFDESGIMPTCIIDIDHFKYLYYIGWSVRKTVPYHNAIGLAISEDGGKSFKKAFEGPIICSTKEEPYFSGTAWVMKDQYNFKMWYLSCYKWDLVNGKLEPFYHIKYAESTDGINWKQTGEVAIQTNPNEGGIASASVIKKNNQYYMWYSTRGADNYRNAKETSYKIGYATSIDGRNWIRKDEEINFNSINTDWDEQMMAYPYVIEGDKQLFMFYNGNGFGLTGFGYATMNVSDL